MACLTYDAWLAKAFFFLWIGASCASEPLPQETSKQSTNEVIEVDPKAVRQFQERQALRLQQQPNTPSVLQAPVGTPQIALPEKTLRQEVHRNFRLVVPTARVVHGKAPEMTGAKP